MTQQIISSLIGVIPCLAILSYHFYQNFNNKERIKQLLIFFALGAFITLPCYFIQTFIVDKGFDGEGKIWELFAFTFFGIAVLEEALKFCAIYFYQKNFVNQSSKEIIYNSLFVAMGFAAVENIIYAFKHDLITIIIRIFTSVPLHASCSIFMGYFLGKYFIGKDKNNLILAFVIPLAIHWLYDLFIEQNWNENFSAISLLILIASWSVIFYFFQKEKQESKIMTQKIEPAIPKVSLNVENNILDQIIDDMKQK